MNIHQLHTEIWTKKRIILSVTCSVKEENPTNWESEDDNIQNPIFTQADPVEPKEEPKKKVIQKEGLSAKSRNPPVVETEKKHRSVSDGTFVTKPPKKSKESETSESSKPQRKRKRPTDRKFSPPRRRLTCVPRYRRDSNSSSSEYIPEKKKNHYSSEEEEYTFRKSYKKKLQNGSVLEVHKSTYIKKNRLPKKRRSQPPVRYGQLVEIL